jgi:hypothetical protein
MNTDPDPLKESVFATLHFLLLTSHLHCYRLVDQPTVRRDCCRLIGEWEPAAVKRLLTRRNVPRSLSSQY